jgi:D-alanyl-lipoteichoic acid acyltransferase DltB (MBOAT superfamily)
VLFNSYAFLFLFLPIVAIGFFQLSHLSAQWAAVWLIGASFFFYGWWNSNYLILLIVSIVINYEIGTRIAIRAFKGRRRAAKTILILGITFNLSLLGYYKYAGFFVENFGRLIDRDMILSITLPLGISFFTFTQIAYLVDAFRGKVTQYNGFHYALFVSYFPHLIAGPILHHHEMIPQFERAETYRFRYENVAVGATIFFIGLFKKVILADGIALHADRVFDAAALNLHLNFLESWSGAICYALQLYFDFSGYSDMAIGISRVFGISLPLNFYSPYKAASIIEFWQRWHMTLSRFLREYLYIPLGGNRKGTKRRYVNLMLTMLLGGLWHGAGWTFIMWGALHGLYLVINHGWRAVLAHQCGRALHLKPCFKALSVLLTFVAVTFAWTFFRAKDMSAALTMVSAMAGQNGFGISEDLLADFGGIGAWLIAEGFATSGAVDNYLVDTNTFFWVAALILLVWFAPNTYQIMHRYEQVTNLTNMNEASSAVQWRPTISAAIITAIIALAAVVHLNARSPFLYFQF